LAEVEQAHRIAYEKEALRVSVAEAKRGQILGFIISISTAAGALVAC
jgi:hypothetical protein